MSVLMAGLPGSGKSTLARELAQRTSGVVLDKDVIRAAVFPAGEIEYSTQQDDFCQQIALNVAEYLVKKNPDRMIFLDGRPFSRKYQIDTVVKEAARLGQRWALLECVCSEATAKRRLESSAHEHLAANRNFAMYRDLKAGFEEISLPKTVLDTDRPLQECVDQALAALR